MSRGNVFLRLSGVPVVLSGVWSSDHFWRQVEMASGTWAEEWAPEKNLTDQEAIEQFANELKGFILDWVVRYAPPAGTA